MAYELEVNHYMRVAVVTLWGRVTAAERADALDALLARMEPGHGYRVLVDMIGAYATPDPRLEQAAVVERLAAEAGRRGLRMAYLYPRGGRANLGMERLAEQRGFAFRRFHAMSEAMDWLLAPPSQLSELPPVTCQATAPSPPRRRWRPDRWFA